MAYKFSLREASVCVVEAIIEWRKLLWRPHPFRYKGVNYLLKMRNDASFYAQHIDTHVQDTIMFIDAKGKFLCSLEKIK